MMNIILAVFLYYATLSLNNFRSEPLPLLNNYSFRFGTQENRIVVGGISPNSPAAKTKIQTGDIALRAGAKIDTAEISWFSISNPDQFINFVKSSDNKELYLDLENLINGETKTIKVTPKYDQKLKRAIIGINLVEATVLTYDKPTEKLFSGFLHSYNMSAYNVSGLTYLFSQSFKQKSVEPIAQGSAGPIGIFKVVDDLVKSSGKKVVLNLLNLLALLSLSLAIINMIPFPALDGGRFVMVLYEWITGRRFNAVIEKYLVVGGFLLLMALALLVAFNDIMRIYR
jgi:regulator of sigma E protease